MNISVANKEDLQTILNLQYLAFQSEARMLNNYNIPPLKQTIIDIEKEYDSGTILKAVDESGSIIGSVRGQLRDNTLHIGKLIVAYDYRRRGVGSSLLKYIETLYPNARYELFTSSYSVDNIRLYVSLGYKRCGEKQLVNDITLIYLEK